MKPFSVLGDRAVRDESYRGTSVAADSTLKRKSRSLAAAADFNGAPFWFSINLRSRPRISLSSRPGIAGTLRHVFR
jgi:hypothetical protein